MLGKETVVRRTGRKQEESGKEILVKKAGNETEQYLLCPKEFYT